MAESMELAPQSNDVPAPIVDDLGPQALDRAAEKLAVMAGLKRLAISYTTTDEWTQFGDKPYLQATGAMKFAEIYGVSFSAAKVDVLSYTDDKGPVIEFFATVTANWRGRTCPAEGVSSTADEFFNGKGRRLPLSEVDRPSVRKKALTQAMANAVKKILGLSFTWDEVKAALGERGDRIQSVQFKGKSEFKTEEKKAGKGEMTPVKEELLHILMQCAEGDQELAKEFLYNWTKFTDKEGNERGSRSVLEMSDAWAAKTLPKAKKMLAEFEKEKGDAGPG